MSEWNITDFKDWLVAQSGVTIIDDSNPLAINFLVDHTNGIGHETFVNNAYKSDMWLLSKGINTELKEYKVGHQSLGVPAW